MHAQRLLQQNYACILAGGVLIKDCTPSRSLLDPLSVCCCHVLFLCLVTATTAPGQGALYLLLWMNIFDSRPQAEKVLQASSRSLHCLASCTGADMAPLQALLLTLMLSETASATSNKAKSVGYNDAAFCRSTHCQVPSAWAKAAVRSALWFSAVL